MACAPHLVGDWPHSQKRLAVGSAVCLASYDTRVSCHRHGYLAADCANSFSFCGTEKAGRCRLCVSPRTVASLSGVCAGVLNSWLGTLTFRRCPCYPPDHALFGSNLNESPRSTSDACPSRIWLHRRCAPSLRHPPAGDRISMHFVASTVNSRGSESEDRPVGNRMLTVVAQPFPRFKRDTHGDEHHETRNV
jgi:hypothetical protein